MKIFKKSLQIFTAISIFALACTSLNAAVTITQDDLSGNVKPDLVEWQSKYNELYKEYGVYDTYETFTPLVAQWRSDSVRMSKNLIYLKNTSVLECRSEMPMGTIWMLIRVDPEDPEYLKTIQINLGKTTGRNRWAYGDAMLSQFPQYTNTVAGTAIMSTATYEENVYQDNNNRWQLVRFDFNLPELFALQISAPSDNSESVLQIKEIIIAPPTAEVNIKKEELEYHPGYPSVLDPTSFRIEVTSTFTNTSVEAKNISSKI